MNLLFDSFWRAVAYCLRPRVVLLSLLPLVLVIGLTVGLGYLFWDDALDQVRRVLESSAFVNSGWAWLDSVGWGRFKIVLPPLIVVFTVTPLIVVVSLLVVALLMTPFLVRLVALRRFAALEERKGASFLHSVTWSLGSTLMALVAMLVSIPLWFVPPLVLVLPPLIWGWLTCRVFAFDVLAAHATAPERRFVLRSRRWSLLAIGVVCGYLGALPSLLWAASAAALIFAPLLVVVSVWLYTLVFAFAACWFAHFTLAELQRLRDAQTPVLSALPSGFATDLRT